MGADGYATLKKMGTDSIFHASSKEREEERGRERKREEEREREKRDAKNGTDARSPSVPIFADALFLEFCQSTAYNPPPTKMCRHESNTWMELFAEPVKSLITAYRRLSMPKARKMLSDWDAPYIQSLVKLIETQSKSTLANWAVDYSGRVLLPLWGKYYPDDPRPQNALKAAREWLSGRIKLPEAKGRILQCHAAAREAENNPVARTAARAIGQSASTVHSARHCIGLALYGALAVAYDALGTDAPREQLERLVAEECERMLDALREVSIENEPNPAKIDWKC